MTARRYLVTGGTGFIGSALVRMLVSRGHAVRILDNNSRGALRRLGDARDAVEVVQADIRDAQAVSAATAGVDSVLHLAYVNGTEFFYSQPELVLDIAVRGMLNVLDACRRHAVPELVLASSSEVYQTPPLTPTAEDAPLSVPDVGNPRFSYGGGKIACELMAMNWGRTGFERVMIFRPHNVYGPDMGWEHVLPQFILRARHLAAAQPSGPVRFPIQGDGTQTRAFIHIDDFARAIGAILDHGRHLEIYHVGNPEELAVAEVARRVLAWFGRDIELVPGELTAGSTQRRCPDIGRLRALGFEPRIDFAAGLPSIAAWYDANAALKP